MTHEVIEAAAPAVPTQQAQAAPQPRQLSVIEHAVRSGASPADLRELMALQRDMDNHQLVLMREKRAMDEEDRTKAAKAAFLRDLAGFRGENIVIPKSKYVDRGKAGSFMQAEYGTAAAMLSPALSKHGFSFRHDMKFGSKRWMTDGAESDVPWVYVTCFLEHREGHGDKLDLDGPPGELSANTPVQNMQATASYLKRQSLLAITGTATQDEDDENGMGGGSKLPKAQRREPDADSAVGQQQQADAEALLDAGRDEAMKGMQALTAWWGALTAKQRSAMNAEFGALRKCASQADRENAP